MGKGVPWEGIDYFAGGYIDMFRYELSMSSLTNGFILTVSFFGELGVHDSPIVKRLKRKNVHHSSNIFEVWLATVKVSWNFSIQKSWIPFCWEFGAPSHNSFSGAPDFPSYLVLVLFIYVDIQAFHPNAAFFSCQAVCLYWRLPVCPRFTAGR